jgi:DNA-directed RNA polymerase subunit RPC12/RpoP
MAMVCPQCKESFEQRLQCPNCSARLVYKSSPRKKKIVDGLERDGKWMQTAGGRIVLGLLLSQGLYFGLRRLFAAGLLAVEESDTGIWSSLFGVLLVQGLQAIGLLVGGTLAGAGYRRGGMLGALVGAISGAISLSLLLYWQQEVNAIALYGQPLVQMVFGAVGGAIGCTIWKPLALEVPDKPDLSPKREQLAPTTHPAKFSGPIAWGRVLVGAVLAIAGTLYAKTLLKVVLDASDGKLSLDTYLQAELVTWEIKALAILLGSVIAGSGTANNLKQGTCVGFAVALVQLTILLSSDSVPLEKGILTIGATMALGLVGGWFGGQMLPPHSASTEARTFAQLTA